MIQEATNNIQDQLINKIKAVLPTNENLVQSISDVLNLSIDSAYRRIRGEKLFNIEEVAVLCKTFKIKFDEEVEIYSNKATFDFTLLEHNKANFKNWLGNILSNLKAISSRPENTILYSADDVPIWHHFNDEILINFKLFYWLKTILGDVDFINKNYDPTLIEPELVQMAKDISFYYNQTTSVEIWTEDSFNSTIKQVEYFWESGFFKDKNEALSICNSIKNEMDLIVKMCINSSKLLSGKENFTMYQSEVMVGNNSIVANIGNTKISYVSYNTFNMMTTTNSLFVNEAEEWLKNLIKKSIQISGVGEKQRNQYFKKLNYKLEITRNKIELS